MANVESPKNPSYWCMSIGSAHLCTVAKSRVDMTDVALGQNQLCQKRLGELANKGDAVHGGF